MGQRGKKTPEAIEEFVVRTYRLTANLSYADAVDKIVASFGKEARVDKSTIGNILKRNGVERSPRGQRDEAGTHDQSGKASPPDTIAGVRSPVLEVEVTSDSEDRDINSDISERFTWPVAFNFSVKNKSDDVVRFAQLHVWVPSKMFLDPEASVDLTWRKQGREYLPAELQVFAMEDAHERWVAQLNPDRNFALIPSDLPYTLPPLSLISSNWDGMLTMPWRIEAPGVPSTSGVLKLWNSVGRFWTEQAGTSIDIERDRATMQRVIKNSASENERRIREPDSG